MFCNNLDVRLLGLLGWLVVLVVIMLLTCGLLPSCVRDVDVGVGLLVV